MNYLFTGLGSIGQRHLRNLYALKGPDDHIYAYRVLRNNRVLDNKLNVIGDDLEERYGIEYVPTLDAAWDKNIDAVFICNPSACHFEVMKAAADHNVNIFCEKPVSSSMEGMDELLDEMEKKGLVNFAGYQQRFHPCVMAARELLESHAIGRVTSVFAELGEDVSGMHKYEDYRTSYTAKKSLGGGVVMTQIHELDYLYSFFGMPESVYAVGGTLADFEIDVEDTADILMKVEHEGYKIPIHVHEDFVQRPATRHCKIVGTDGMILFDLLQNRISVYNRAGELTKGEVFDFDRNNMFYDEMKAFLDSLREKKATTIPVREGVASLKIALAVKESMETGEIVRLQG